MTKETAFMDSLSDLDFNPKYCLTKEDTSGPDMDWTKRNVRRVKPQSHTFRPFANLRLGKKG